MEARRMPRSLSAARAVAVLALVALVAPAARAASGTDLVFGYAWRDGADGAVWETAPIDGPTTTTTPANDAAPARVDLPFTFPFYGTGYTAMWVSQNGWISFVPPGGNSYPVPAPIPTAAAPNAFLAPLWDDLETNAAGDMVQWGPISAVSGFKVVFRGRRLPDRQPAWFSVVIYADGRIKFHYEFIIDAPTILNTTIGIESAAGDDGIQIAAGGVVYPGVPDPLPVDYVLEFNPSRVLPADCPTIPEIGCTTQTRSLPGGGSGNIEFWGCGGGQFRAQEDVVKFTVTEPSLVDISVNAATNVQGFLLDACNESLNCVTGPFTTVSVPLGVGTYLVAADALAVADEGPYTISILCTPLAGRLACPGMVSDTTVGGPSRWDSYPCAGLTDLSGPESFSWINTATATNIHATLSGASAAGLDVLLLDAGVGLLDPQDCLAWGDLDVDGWNLPAGDYLVVIDGVAGASGAYDLSATCGIDLDCSTPAGTVTVGAATPFVTVGGDSTGNVNLVQAYSCADVLLWDGAEDVWVLQLDDPGHVALRVGGATAGLSAFLLDPCNEGGCLTSVGAGSACAKDLAAGTYWLVVDGVGGAEGPYDLDVIYEPPLPRWTACQEPAGPPTEETTTESPYWNLADNAFCTEICADGTSCNLTGTCPDGSECLPNPLSTAYQCSFAMYVTVPCGTEFHIPLFDTEGGHVRVFDVFRNEYVTLNASSFGGGGWFETGTDIVWQDADCVNGSDPRWNETTTDISFQRDEGICGVFRLEFIEHSGNVWQLYANCTGDAVPQFFIHDSLCGALDAYDPLPNLSFESVQAVADCPDTTINYMLRNDGCVDVVDFPVVVFEDGAPIHAELIPLVPAATTVSGSFPVTFPSLPTGRITVEADPYDVVLECNESPGNACRVPTGVEAAVVPGCGLTCQVVAQAGISPPRMCEGSTASIDAGTSSSSLCPGGVLEYQLRIGAVVVAPWQLSPVFAGLSPAVATEYSVDVRCADPAERDTCVDTVRLDLEVDRLPLMPNDATATDLSNCALDIEVQWSAATFFGPTSAGRYNIYRSEISTADALTRPPVATCIDDVRWIDTATVAEGVYYYVIEAEDENVLTTCTPRGSCRGGSTTQVEANLGVGVTDAATAQPDLLPKIACSLRLGGSLGGVANYGPTFVQLVWTSDRPLTGLEHFHLLRSEAPDSGFVQLNSEPPFLTVGDVFDVTADHPDVPGSHVFFYLVFTVDECENENLGSGDPRERCLR